MRARVFAVLMVAVAMIARSSHSVCPAAELVDPAKLERVVKPLVDTGWAYGVAVGLINERGVQFGGYGRISEHDPRPPAIDTEFEIGSITKVFTGLLLAQMAAEGLVDLHQPAQSLLGDLIPVPRGDREITLVDLATHSSGLPRMPSNFSPADPTNPYADYSVEQFGRFLGRHRLVHQPGTRAEYSNAGMGLLGLALAERAGTNYEQLVISRICQPLGMADTMITLGDAQRTRLATGHDCDGYPEANWDLPTLAGAGALRSSVADMLKFLSANLGFERTPFDNAIALSHAVHFRTPRAGSDAGLGWQVQVTPRVVWHNGQTGGYHSFCAFSPGKRSGLVVLCNTAALHVDELGFRLGKLLTTGDAEPLELPSPIKLDSSPIGPLLGHYQLPPTGRITIAKDADGLLMQVRGQPPARLYRESSKRFFVRAVDCSLTFESDQQGYVDKLVMHINGANLSAPKMNE